MLKSQDCPPTPADAFSYEDASSCTVISPESGPVFVLDGDSFRVTRFVPFMTVRICFEAGQVYSTSLRCRDNSQVRGSITQHQLLGNSPDPNEWTIRVSFAKPSRLFVTSARRGRPIPVPFPVSRWGREYTVKHTLVVPFTSHVIIHQIVLDDNGIPEIIRHDFYDEMPPVDPDDFATAAAGAAQEVSSVSTVSSTARDPNAKQANAAVPSKRGSAPSASTHLSLSAIDLTEEENASGFSILVPVLPAVSASSSSAKSDSGDDGLIGAALRADLQLLETEGIFSPPPTPGARFFCKPIYIPCCPLMSLQPVHNAPLKSVALGMARFPMMITVTEDKQLYFGSHWFHREKIPKVWDTRYSGIAYKNLSLASKLLFNRSVAQKTVFPFSSNIEQAYRSKGWDSEIDVFETVRASFVDAGFLDDSDAHRFYAGLEKLIWYYAANAEQPFVVNSHIARFLKSTKKLNAVIEHPYEESSAIRLAIHAYQKTDTFYSVLNTLHTRLSWSFDSDLDNRVPEGDPDKCYSNITSAMTVFQKSPYLHAIAFYGLFVLAYHYRASVANVHGYRTGQDFTDDPLLLFEMSKTQYESVIRYLAYNKAAWVDLIGTPAACEIIGLDFVASCKTIADLVEFDLDRPSKLWSYIDTVVVAVSRACCQFTQLLINRGMPSAGAADDDGGDDASGVQQEAVHRRDKKRSRSEVEDQTDSDLEILSAAMNKKAKSAQSMKAPASEVGSTSSSSSLVVDRVQLMHRIERTAKVESSSVVVCPVSGRLVVVNHLMWILMFKGNDAYLSTSWYQQVQDNLEELQEMRMLAAQFMPDANKKMIEKGRETIDQFGAYLITQGAAIGSYSMDVTKYMLAEDTDNFPMLIDADSNAKHMCYSEESVDENGGFEQNNESDEE